MKKIPLNIKKTNAKNFLEHYFRTESMKMEFGKARMKKIPFDIESLFDVNQLIPIIKYNLRGIK